MCENTKVMKIKVKNTKLTNEIVQVYTSLSLTHFIFAVNYPSRIPVLQRQRLFISFPSLTTINICHLSEVPSSSSSDLSLSPFQPKINLSFSQQA